MVAALSWQRLDRVVGQGFWRAMSIVLQNNRYLKCLLDENRSHDTFMIPGCLSHEAPLP